MEEPGIVTVSVNIGSDTSEGEGNLRAVLPVSFAWPGTGHHDSDDPVRTVLKSRFQCVAACFCMSNQ